MAHSRHWTVPSARTDRELYSASSVEEMYEAGVMTDLFKDTVFRTHKCCFSGIHRPKKKSANLLGEAPDLGVFFLKVVWIRSHCNAFRPQSMMCLVPAPREALEKCRFSTFIMISPNVNERFKITKGWQPHQSLGVLLVQLCSGVLLRR